MMEPSDQELLSAYADNELGRDELAYVTRRLSESEEWREELAHLQRMKTSLRALPQARLPADVRSALLDVADRRPLSARLRPAWAWSATVAAAAALAVVLLRPIERAPEPLSLEPLMAAHLRYETESAFHAGAARAARYTAYVKSVDR